LDAAIASDQARNITGTIPETIALQCAASINGNTFRNSEPGAKWHHLWVRFTRDSSIDFLMLSTHTS
jgi:hypothetical protein